MQRFFLKSKIHQAKITSADLYYEGSLSIDLDLMEQSEILENEKVSVVNINNGERFETYTIPAKRGSGIIGLNGAAARKGAVGDRIIIISYCLIDTDSVEFKNYAPNVLLLDENNKIKSSTNIIQNPNT